MKKVAIGNSSRKKRKLIATFHLKQKPIYCKTAKPLIFKIHLMPLQLTNNLMKYIFANKYNLIAIKTRYIYE